MKYTLSGNLRIGKKIQKFTKELEADSEDAAKERLYTLYGSAHGTKRRWINIDKVEKTTV